MIIIDLTYKPLHQIQGIDTLTIRTRCCQNRGVDKEILLMNASKQSEEYCTSSYEHLNLDNASSLDIEMDSGNTLKWTGSIDVISVNDNENILEFMNSLSKNASLGELYKFIDSIKE